MFLIEKAFTCQDEELYAVDLDKFFESVFIENVQSTYIMRDELYPLVEKVLSTPLGDRKFKQAVGEFIDRNSSKLHTPGPQYMIPFGDKDKQLFLSIFDLDKRTVVRMIDKVVDTVRGTGTSDFNLLRKNECFWIFYECIRFYTLQGEKAKTTAERTSASKGLNTALIIYALSAYPSIFSKYFTFEVKSPKAVGAMMYTIDQLTNKFIIKQQGSIFKALTYSIQQSYLFLKPYFKDGSDTEIIRFIQRIRNDHNSMLKNIFNQFKANFDAGRRIDVASEVSDGNPIIDDEQNNTSIVEDIGRRVLLALLTNGVENRRMSICAQMTGISISDSRYYMNKIISDKYTDKIQKFIESILFLYLYDDSKKREDINSSNFIVWANATFKKTNSTNENIVRIKRTLDEWAEETGVHEKFKREGSRVSYKKAIYFYFILTIQVYTN